MPFFARRKINSVVHVTVFFSIFSQILSMENQTLKRELGLLDGVMLVAGSMIGSGIFIVSSDMVRQVGSAGWLIALWAFTALFTMMAAVSYGELSAMFPQAGGQYVYLKEAYGKRMGFLYGWSFFTVIQTGTIAAVAVAFAKFLGFFFPVLGESNVLFQIGNWSFTAAQIVAIVSVWITTYLNMRGVKEAKWIQTILTLIKIGSLLGLIVCCFIWGANAEIWNANWAQAWEMQIYTNGSWTDLLGIAVVGGMAAALVGSVFSSDAWNGVTFLAGEIKRPERNVGLSLLLGTSLVGLLYIITNLMYLAVVPLQAMASAPSDRVAVVVADAAFGQWGAAIVAVMIIISTFACNNGLIMSGSRVLYTMGKDGLFLKQSAQLNQNNVPQWALVAQAVWVSVLCLTGKYGLLLDFVVVIVLLFYILTIYALFHFRKTRPDHPRPYKAFGYPVIPLVYMVCATAIVVALFVFKPWTSLAGFGLLLLGLPVYRWMNRA